jgi:hypothetical protein
MFRRRWHWEVRAPLARGTGDFRVAEGFTLTAYGARRAAMLAEVDYEDRVLTQP